ncbi:Uncharacterised protein [Escherichia coli]|uniref:Uncharacterized protein n=1 Tax=Escherichia coli TaxID=562 RepID=A0A376KLN0_ECOLX|nr:Uncharacterised protein [Escherichia coli]
MNSLLILLYVVVWRVCTILRVIVPVSAVRAWCEYQLEGMTILRDAYSSLAKAAGMQNEAFEYLKDIARHLGYESGGDQLKSGLFRPFLWHIRCERPQAGDCHGDGGMEDMEERLQQCLQSMGGYLQSMGAWMERWLD